MLRDKITIWSIAVLAAVMGVVNLLSAWHPALSERMHLIELWLPGEVRSSARLGQAVAGFMLLLLALNLTRRKQVAWLLTIAGLIAAVIFNLLKGLDYEEASLSALLLLWLIYNRSRFYARSDGPSLVTGVKIFAISIVFTLIYGVMGFYVLEKRLRVPFGLIKSARQTLNMFIKLSDPKVVIIPPTRWGKFFADSIYAVGTASLVYALIMILHPVLLPYSRKEDEIRRVAGIVSQYGKTALSQIAMLPDKQYFFWGNSVIAYTLRGRVAITLGGPIGPVEETGQVIDNFIKLCNHSDWQPVFYQLAQADLLKFKHLKFNLAAIGSDAIVAIPSFSLTGPEMKDIRYSVNKMIKMGMAVKVFTPPHSDGLLAQLRSINQQWLRKQKREMKFVMGWFDEDYLQQRAIITIVNQAQQILAFVVMLQGYSPQEVALDLGRNVNDLPNRLINFLYVQAINWAKELGYTRLNLGLSALVKSDKLISSFLPLWRSYNFQGIHDFKEKFHPQWDVKYVAFQSKASIPAITLAFSRL